jgi:hypothetical protein
MYGNDSYGGTEYAGSRASNSSVITIVSGALNSAYLLTKDTTLRMFTTLRRVVLGTKGMPVELQSNNKPVTLTSKSDKIIL